MCETKQKITCTRCGICCQQGGPCDIRKWIVIPYEADNANFVGTCSLLRWNEDGTTTCVGIEMAFDPDPKVEWEESARKWLTETLVGRGCERPDLKKVWHETNKRFGHFEGRLLLEIPPPPSKRKWWEWFLPLRPQAIVRSDFSFVEPDGTKWVARDGDEFNGISSPWCFWRLMPPFSWREIRAAVLHDPECVRRTKPSWRVHRMLRLAMRCDHASPLRAWIAWVAVIIGGPRFPRQKET